MEYLPKGLMIMPDITNKTLEDILKEIVLTHGQIGIIIAVGIIALLLGGFIEWLYLTKFKYVSVNTKLEQLEQENGQLANKLREANSKIDNLESEIKKLETEIQDIQGYRFAKVATKPDSQDEALKVFIGDNENTKR